MTISSLHDSYGQFQPIYRRHGLRGACQRQCLSMGALPQIKSFSIVALPQNIITSQGPPVIKEWGGYQRPQYIELGYVGEHMGWRGESVQIPKINQPKSSRWNNEIMPLIASIKSISWELNTWLEGATGLRARIWVMGVLGGTLGGCTQPKITKVAPWSEVNSDISTSSVVS